MTIKKLLKDPKNCWSLEIYGYAEEHACLPYYDDGDFNSFDELPTLPMPQGFFDESYSKWGSLVVIYEGEDEENIEKWYRWLRFVRSVNFIFRKRENNVIKKMWVFHDVCPCDFGFDSLRGLNDVTLEFNFTRFENVDLQSPRLKYNGDG
jgi:hypothetical protein